MANWSNPLLTSTYTNFLTEVKDRDTDLALQFDGTTSTNIPTNTIRWNSSINRWQKWSGSAWGELTATYALTALTTTTTVTATGNVSGAALVPSSATIPVAGIFLPAANTLAFATATTERLRIDSTGRVGIGTSSPSGGLHLANPTAGSAADFVISNPANNWSIKTGTTTNALTIVDNQYSAERLRIDSTGRLLIGTSTSRGNFKIGATLYDAAKQLEVGTQGFQSFVGGNAAPGGPYLMLAHQRSGSVGGNTALVFNDEMGTVSFHGADGTNLVIGASIRAEVDNTPGANDMPGRLVFSTTADGAATPTERMRIDSFGLISIAGPGIKFPPTQVAAADPNTLDDYEEGTFTPTVIGGTTSGTGTYTVQTGKYVKVGGKVYVEVAMTWTAHTGTGAMQFAGLPFTAASTGNAPGVSFGRVSNIALTASNLLLGFVAANTTTVPLRQYAVGGGAEASVTIDTAGEVNFSATYMVV